VRFKVLEQTHPSEARHMLQQAQLAVEERYKLYEDLASRDGSRFHPHWQEL
jgi:pyruvate-ferredoxin/flavodoxin oxidoreductase